MDLPENAREPVSSVPASLRKNRQFDGIHFIVVSLLMISHQYAASIDVDKDWHPKLKEGQRP
jgi:hypothetical protein